MAKKRGKRGSKGRARKKTVVKEKTKHPLVKGLLVAGAAALMISYSAFRRSEYTAPKPAPAVSQPEPEVKPSVEDIINRYAVIENTPDQRFAINGTVYLISMEHHQFKGTKEGLKRTDKASAYVPREFAQVFLMYHELATHGYLDLIVGEGIQQKKLTITPEKQGWSEATWQQHRVGMLEPSKAEEYFKKNPNHTSYIAFAFLFPELAPVWGMDPKSWLDEYNSVDMNHRARTAEFQKAIKELPPNSDGMRQMSALLYNFMEDNSDFHVQKDMIHIERSCAVLRDLQVLANGEQADGIAVMYGRAHAPHLFAGMTTKRVYKLRPKVLPAHEPHEAFFTAYAQHALDNGLGLCDPPNNEQLIMLRNFHTTQSNKELEKMAAKFGLGIR